MPEEEIISLVTETVSEKETEEEKKYPYQASSKGYTFYITEYYATNQGVFLGVQIESEEKLPGFYEPTENNMDIKGLALEEDASLFENALEECTLYKKAIDTIE